MDLKSTEIEFLRRLVADKPLTRPASGRAAAYFEANFALGSAIRRKIEYQPGDYLRASAMLANAGLGLEAYPPGTQRGGTSGDVSEKIGVERPHDNSVRVKWASGTPPPASLEGTLQRGSYLTMRWEDVAQYECDVVMVVENVETFRYLHDYQWINYEGKSVLAIFRGDKEARMNDSQRAIETRKVIWYFGDFDPQGLSELVRWDKCGNLGRVIHPPLDWLKKEHARLGVAKLYAENLSRCERIVSESQRPDIAALWDIMRRVQVGIPQERMCRLS